MRPPNVGYSTLFTGERLLFSSSHVRFLRRMPAPSLSGSSTCRRLELFDGAGRIRMMLTTTPNEGAPWLSLYDSAGNGRLVMGLRVDGTPFPVLWDAEGRTIFETLHSR